MVAALSKAWTVSARLKAGVVGSNFFVSLFCVCVVLCVRIGCSPVQGVLLTVYRIKELKKRPGPNKELQSH
jgi:hypothetical protein